MNNIIFILGALIVGALITFVVCYFIPKEKVRSTNQEILQKEQQTQLRIKDLENEYLVKQKELEEKAKVFQDNLEKIKFQTEQQQIKTEQEIAEKRRNWELEKSKKDVELIQQEELLKTNISNLEGQIKEKKKSIELLGAQANTVAQEMTQKSLDAAISGYEQKLYFKEQDYIKQAEKAKQEYYALIKDFQNSYLEYSTKLEEELKNTAEKLAEEKAKANATTESNKRAQLEKEQKDFYRLQLSDIDIEEISKIRSIEPYLRQKEPLNKVIWKVYYEKPYTDLIGRVLGSKTRTGIYKITNLINGMVYIGQAVSVQERWRQHIKRGVGADPPTQNKLYPAMLEYGVENFTFELLEECPATKLTEREKFYTDFYNAQTYGYVVRKG